MKTLMMRRRKRGARRFAIRYAKHEPEVCRLAHAMARGDSDLADDLRQVGLIALWLAELQSGRTSDDWMRLKHVVRWRMLRGWRELHGNKRKEGDSNPEEFVRGERLIS